MESKRKWFRPGDTSLRFILSAMVLTLCLGLGGCTKNCAEAEKELTRYADGSKPVGDEAKVLKECKEVIDKCVGQTVPYEVMGDIDAKNKKFDAAVKSYERVLVTDSGNARVKGKIEKIIAEAKEIAEKEAEKILMSIKAMPLSKYAQLDPSIRLTWCERYMAFGKAAGDQRMEVLYTTTAQQFDDELVRLAAASPNDNTGDAAYKYMLSNVKVRLKRR